MTDTATETTPIRETITIDPAQFFAAPPDAREALLHMELKNAARLLRVKLEAWEREKARES